VSWSQQPSHTDVRVSTRVVVCPNGSHHRVWNTEMICEFHFLQIPMPVSVSRTVYFLLVLLPCRKARSRMAFILDLASSSDIQISMLFPFSSKSSNGISRLGVGPVFFSGIGTFPICAMVVVIKTNPRNIVKPEPKPKQRIWKRNVQPTTRSLLDHYLWRASQQSELSQKRDHRWQA